MYQRFKRGLVKPSELSLYLKDSWARIGTYFFLLTLIIMLPFFITEYTTAGFTGHQMSVISAEFQQRLSGPYEIVDGELTIPSENLQDVKYVSIDLYTIGLINRPSNLEYQVIELVFTTTGIRYSVLRSNSMLYPYSEIGLENFSFNDYSSQNKDRLIYALNQVLSSNQVSNKTFQTMIFWFSTIFELMFLILIASLFNRGQMAYPFKLKIAVYASTIYVMCSLLAVLFGFGLLVYAGILMLVIYMNRAFSQIIIL